MNYNVPETLPELSFPEPQASRSVEGNAAWGLCSQHQDVPKDSRGLVSSCPLPFGFCPPAAFEAHSICPLGTPVVARDSIPASFSVLLMTLGYTILLFLGPSLELKPPPFSACL